MIDLWKPRRLFSLALAVTLVGFAAGTCVSGAAPLPCGCGGGGKGGLPPAPSPCAVDGTCRANTREWGHYHTRWRLWPGEVLEKPPTPAEGPEIDEETQLDPFERPSAEKEEVRGPSKTKTDEADGPDEAEEALQELPEVDQPVPEVDALPDFELQGSLRNPAPQEQEDAPPALPQSLRRVSQHARGSSRPAQRTVVPASATLPSGPVQQAPAASRDLRHLQPSHTGAQVAQQPQKTTLRLVSRPVH